ncbi:hypothetical protein H0H93_008989 [Arthromyces matolae]|nr:hypothetical protein H0H93_008989 [Arthromyces matolae]
MIRQFRFDGLQKWKLGTIIEGLPLILHTSVAIFLVGLSFYVSQLSPPICAILSSITILTFIFYLVTSMIPAFSIDCPFRLPSVFFVACLLRVVVHAIRRVFLKLLMRIFPTVSRVIPVRYRVPLVAPLETLGEEEYSEAMKSYLHWRCLTWIFDHSTNNSTKDVVLEGICGLLDRIDVDYCFRPIGPLVGQALVYSAHCQNELEHRSNSDTVVPSIWDTYINKVLRAHPKLLVFEAEWELEEEEEESLQEEIWKRYVAAWQAEDLPLREHCLSILHKVGMEALPWYVLNSGNQRDIRCAMDLNTRDIFLEPAHGGATLLHIAAAWGKLEAVIALIDTNPELMEARTLPPSSHTALHYAIFKPIDFNPQIAEYLMDHGASAPASTLHFAACLAPAESIVLLLDRGWDRTAKDQSGATPIDLARIQKARYDSGQVTVNMYKRNMKAIDYLENYQTVPRPHPNMLRTPIITSEHDLAPDIMPLSRTTTSSTGVTAESGNHFLDIQVIPRKWKWAVNLFRKT